MFSPCCCTCKGCLHFLADGLPSHLIICILAFLTLHSQALPVTINAVTLTTMVPGILFSNAYEMFMKTEHMIYCKGDLYVFTQIIVIKSLRVTVTKCEVNTEAIAKFSEILELGQHQGQNNDDN